MQTMPHPTANSSTQHPPEAFGLPPNWRPPYVDTSRYDRGGRESFDRDRDRDRERERGRHTSYTGRNPRRMSPVQMNKPIHFTVDAQTSSITINGDSRYIGAVSLSSSLPSITGLPAKPVLAVSSSSSVPAINSSLLERMKPPPPPPGHKPDPRSRVSYQDLDRVESSDDIALQY